MSKILCFGELLLRYCPDPEGQWTNNNSVPVYIGGAELNVANALSKWGMQVAYCTAIPKNYMSDSIVKSLQINNIDTNTIIYSGSRIGSYYLPLGAEVKNAGVIYDRFHSSFYELKPGMIDWNQVLEGCTWLHLSAICPALTQDIADLCTEALICAKQKGISTSIDLNFRKALWQYGTVADKVMQAILQHCDHIMGNIWAIESLCGIKSTITDSTNKSDKELKAAGIESIKNLKVKFSNIQSVALTYRLGEKYWALLNQKDEFYTSIIFNNFVQNDRVGSGDCFMAGIIYGITNQKNAQETIDFAASAAVGKLAELGDATHQSVNQILERIKNNA